MSGIARLSGQPSEPDAAVARLAARQHGNVTHQQLLAAGLTRDAIAHRVRAGRLHRVHRGVFAVGRPPVTPLERASAAVLACGPSAALSHAGALKLWGFARRWPPSFEVTVRTGNPRPPSITVHRFRALRPGDFRVQLGIRATSPARTLLDCAPAWPAARLARLVNDALLTPFLSRGQLAEACARFRTHPAVRLLRPFLELADGPTRSDFEDLFLAFCERHRLPRPEVNTRVAGHEVDAYFPGARLIVELDGWTFHRDRQSFESDRERDAESLAAGLPTVRVTWQRLIDEPEREAARLHAIVARLRAG